MQGYPLGEIRLGRDVPCSDCHNKIVYGINLLSKIAEARDDILSQLFFVSVILYL